MKLFLFLVFQQITQFSLAQKVNDDTNYFDYTYNKKIVSKNKIEKITVESFSLLDKIGKREYYFDRMGLLLETKIFNTKDKLISKYLYALNGSEDLINIFHYDFEIGKADTIFYFKKYFKNRIIEDSIIREKNYGETLSYTHDNKDRVIQTKINYYLGNATMSSSKIISYENNNIGQPIKIKESILRPYYDSNWMEISRRNLEYNSNGTIKSEIEELELSVHSLLDKGNSLYFYDNFKNLVEIKRNKSKSIKYKYNKMGLLSNEESMFYIDEDKIEMTNKYTYQYRKK